MHKQRYLWGDISQILLKHLNFRCLKSAAYFVPCKTGLHILLIVREGADPKTNGEPREKRVFVNFVVAGDLKQIFCVLNAISFRPCNFEPMSFFSKFLIYCLPATRSHNSIITPP